MVESERVRKTHERKQSEERICIDRCHLCNKSLGPKRREASMNLARLGKGIESPRRELPQAYQVI